MMNFFAWGDLGRHCLSDKAVRSDHPINAHLEPVNKSTFYLTAVVLNLGELARQPWFAGKKRYPSYTSKDKKALFDNLVRPYLIVDNPGHVFTLARLRMLNSLILYVWNTILLAPMHFLIWSTVDLLLQHLSDRHWVGQKFCTTGTLPIFQEDETTCGWSARSWQGVSSDRKPTILINFQVSERNTDITVKMSQYMQFQMTTDSPLTEL